MSADMCRLETKCGHYSNDKMHGSRMGQKGDDQKFEYLMSRTV